MLHPLPAHLLQLPKAEGRGHTTQLRGPGGPYNGQEGTPQHSSLSVLLPEVGRSNEGEAEAWGREGE